MWGQSHLWIALRKGRVKLSERQLDHKAAIVSFLSGSFLGAVEGYWDVHGT